MNEAQYQAWKQNRLLTRLPHIHKNRVNIGNPGELSGTERKSIIDLVSTHNFAIYQLDENRFAGPETLSRMCRQLPLTRSIPNPGADENNVTEITSAGDSTGQETRSRYIPYTRKALKWHTDGYYNDESLKVRSFVLHCSQDAGNGGLTKLLDSDIAYILIRDQNPAWAKALCQPGLFTIPENIDNGILLRSEFSGTVFSTDGETGCLYTRFSQRTKNIQWIEEGDARQAVDAFNSILDRENPWILSIHLRPGQGIICNNILHARTEYDDVGQRPRRLLRMRFGDAIPQTF